MGKNNTEPTYPIARVQNNNLSFSSVDSNKYKMEGNGAYYQKFLMKTVNYQRILSRIHRRFVSLRHIPIEQTNV